MSCDFTNSVHKIYRDQTTNSLIKLNQKLHVKKKQLKTLDLKISKLSSGQIKSLRKYQSALFQEIKLLEVQVYCLKSELEL